MPLQCEGQRNHGARSPQVFSNGHPRTVSQPTSQAATSPDYTANTRFVSSSTLQLREYVKELHISFTLSYVSPCIFYCWVSVYVRKKSEAESVPAVGRVRESVYEHTPGRGLECLPHSVVQFIVGNWAPVLRLLIAHWPEVWKEMNQSVSPQSALAPTSWFHGGDLSQSCEAEVGSKTKSTALRSFQICHFNRNCLWWAYACQRPWT